MKYYFISTNYKESKRLMGLYTFQISWAKSGNCTNISSPILGFLYFYICPINSPHNMASEKLVSHYYLKALSNKSVFIKIN